MIGLLVQSLHAGYRILCLLQVDLIVDPDATFFKASWSKHTNFCQKDIEISQNSGQMAYGQEIQYQVSLLRVHPLVLPFT